MWTWKEPWRSFLSSCSFVRETEAQGEEGSFPRSAVPQGPSLPSVLAAFQGSFCRLPSLGLRRPLCPQDHELSWI